MTDVVPRHEGALERPSHGPGRALGQKRKPQLRLSMGFQDEQRGGAPVKTDHFLPRGDDRAVTKFMAVYGDKPRAIDIRLPGSLAGFLDIRHVAFAGGYLRAIGDNNFATLGSLGGPDRLTIFEKPKEGEELMEVEEVAITGTDDPAARNLDVFLRMTVSFGVPDVLGFGGLAQVTSRGKESMDTLWETAVDIYGQLGSYAMVALRPKLVLKASTMLTPLGIRAEVFVLDLWLPESLDEVYERLERHHALVPAQGVAATALLYGGEPGDEEPQVDSGRRDTPPTPTETVSEAALSGRAAVLPPETPFGPEREFSIPVDVAEAAEEIFPSGKYAGKKLREVASDDAGRRYLLWAARTWREPIDFVESLKVYVEGLSS